ncbi:hypothetical protein ACPOL_1405 [Acidisarcina polymorpha]|uniref:Uncharacterized protein n=1 Tax=Acidisarcina polymorpha TaxID=2211140 RepID=A0A2Z5FV36_9BACT|nr:hypothetical protein ACPOL_1405 [Acidisarcina polymorpha]
MVWDVGPSELNSNDGQGKPTASLGKYVVVWKGLEAGPSEVWRSAWKLQGPVVARGATIKTQKNSVKKESAP